MEHVYLESVEQAVEAVKSNDWVCPVGASTKPLLQRTGDGCTHLDCRGLNGLLEYEPTEFTFTAYSGTPLKIIQQELEAHGQFLPFDPPFAELNATLGGAIASGINGSSSLRYGGVRDFVLGNRFIDGQGNLVTSGGKVVKNAAGFDLPKFMVGSCGRFGLLTEATLKVFPQPVAFETLIFQGELASLVDWIKCLILTPLEVDAIDMSSGELIIRIGGSTETIDSARKRIESLLDRNADKKLNFEEDAAYWQRVNQFSAEDDQELVLLKIPCQINDLIPLQSLADQFDAKWRVSIGGQVVYWWLDPSVVEPAQAEIRKAGLQHLAIRGPAVNSPVFKGGLWTAMENALDPERKFSGPENV